MVNPPARNPFDILPANVFNLFSTQGYGNLSRHYMAILLRVYTLAEFNRFGLTREVVLAEIVDYLAAEGAQAYRLNQPRASDTIRLTLFDEAFSKMSARFLYVRV